MIETNNVINRILCDGICSKCKYGKVVPDPDPDDWFNDDDCAVFCTNPNNNMVKEWPSKSQRDKIMEVERYKSYVTNNNWTYIVGMLRPYEVNKIAKSNNRIEM